MDLDQTIIAKLRRLAYQGEGPCKLAEMIGNTLGLSGTKFRLLAIVYFREAFALSIPDAAIIGAAPFFGEPRSATDVDAELRPHIEATRHVWARGLKNDGAA